MRWTKADEAERERCLNELRKHLKPGDTLHTVLRHVSKSGMMRRISPVIILPDGNTLHPDYLVAVAVRAEHPRKTKTRGGDGIPISGCGMDMGFHLVSTLSAYLYPEGFGCIGEGCPSNDHSNGDRDYTPHGAWNGSPDMDAKHEHWHRSGDYAIRHRWI